VPALEDDLLFKEYRFAVEHILQRGLHDNVYYITSMDDRQLCKYAYDKDRGWHTTGFEQRTVKDDTGAKRVVDPYAVTSLGNRA